MTGDPENFRQKTMEEMIADSFRPTVIPGYQYACGQYYKISAPPEDQVCAACRHFSEEILQNGEITKSEGLGDCRHESPRANVGKPWPLVQTGWHCGQWAER